MRNATGNATAVNAVSNSSGPELITRSTRHANHRLTRPLMTSGGDSLQDVGEASEAVVEVGRGATVAEHEAVGGVGPDVVLA